MESDLTHNTQSVTANKQSSFLVNLLSILLLVSCLIAGFFAYQTQNLVKELTKLKTSPKPIATIAPTPDPIPTCVPLPTCAYNLNPDNPTCKIGANPPDGGVWCSRSTEVSVACTIEAKVCPDGSYVGRSGPKCEFDPCPTQKP